MDIPLRFCSVSRSRCGTCGVDLVDFDLEIPGIRLIKANIETLPIEDNSVDIVFPAVMEHVANPARVFEEVCRILPSKWQLDFLDCQSMGLCVNYFQIST